MNNLAYVNSTEFGDLTVRASPEQGTPPGESATEKRSVKRFTWHHLLAACLIIALLVAVIAVSVHFGKKSNTEEVSCLPSPPRVKLDYIQDANFMAYVVLVWPWSSAMNNSNSPVYEEGIRKADYWVNKIFQSSSRSSCFKSVAKDMLRFGGNILLLVHLNVACERMRVRDIEKAYEEGYSLLLTTQDKSCLSNINQNISVKRINAGITKPLLIPSTICGQSQLYPAPRIVGGQPVRRGQYPWVVMLLKDGEFDCGATIWDYDHILTAAHCVDDFLMDNLTGVVNTSILKIIAGKWEFDLDSQYTGEQRVSVASGRMHTSYQKRDTGELEYDIALLKLNQSLLPTQLVMKVCHPSANDTLPEQGIVAGWGTTNQKSGRGPDSLLGVQLTLLDHYTCGKLFNFTENSPSDLPIGTMCGIGNELKGKDSCEGDSGGPIFWNLGTAVDQRYTIVGVVSYGVDCGELGYPGVYASVQFHLDWIRDTINFL